MRKIHALFIGTLAACGMRPVDVAGESTFVALTLMDWSQTNGITARCTEGNPLIGNCGQNIQPGLYFPLVVGLHIAAAWLMPEAWRGLFEGISIGFEAKSVLHNFELHDAITF